MKTLKKIYWYFFVVKPCLVIMNACNMLDKEMYAKSSFKDFCRDWD